MRIAYLLSSYLHLTSLTSPSEEWINGQLDSHGIDSLKYNDWSMEKAVILAIYTAGVIICELFYSHRFYISQTSEETKYPYKPHRCMASFAVMLAVEWTWPYNRFLHLVFLCCIQRIVVNHLAIIQVRMLSPKGLMYLVIPYCFGAIFRAFIFWYVIYWSVILLAYLFVQAVKEVDVCKLICGVLYVVSAGLYYKAITDGWETALLYSLITFMVMNYLFIKPYYDFMRPYLKQNEQMWKNRQYNLW